MGLSLIEYDQAHHTYQLTPLFRKELLSKLKEYQSCHKAAFEYYRTICETQASIDPILVEEWIFHALGCGEEEIVSEHGGRLVKHLRERLAYQESRRVGLWIMKEKKQKLSKGHDSFLLNELASTLKSLGEYRDAINYYEQALTIDRTFYGKEHLNIARDLNNLGTVWRALGEPEKAIEHCEQAMNIVRAGEVESKHPDFFGVVLDNLGAAWGAKGDYHKAIEYSEYALTVLKKVFGETHPNLAIALNNLGSAWYNLENHQKATSYFNQALAIDLSVYGKVHPDVATDLNNLGAACYGQGDYGKAIGYYEEALTMWRKIYQEKHQNIAAILYNLGKAYFALGKNEKAKKSAEEAYSFFIDLLGVKHPIAEDVGKLLSEIMGETEESSSEYLESELRNAVSKGLYSDGEKYLNEIMQISSERKDRLKREFGFIYNFDKLDKDEKNWEQREAQIDWRRKVWQVLSVRSNFELSIPEVIETQENIKDLEKEKSGSIVDVEKRESKVIENVIKITTSEKKGEKLEKVVFELFKKFFERCEQEKEKFQITNARQQDRGRQSGHDLKFVIGITRNRKMRILVECKNVIRQITKDDIGGKLLAAEVYHQNIPIDHWILVSPNADVSNELDELLELWEKTGKYPFKVQAWTPAAGVKEFFGIIPGIYDMFFKPSKGEVHPGDWDRETKQKVQEFWRQKLEPPIRLPKGWEQYLRSPGKFLLHGDPLNLEALYKKHVTMNCKDDKESLIRGKTLEGKVNEWLEKPVKQHPTLLLLGEFGDGKTVFCYILSRKHVEKFLESPSNGWLPVRFSLKDFTIENVNNSRDFVRRRLEEFGADINGWNTLKKSEYKLLAILDGFDEISKKLDHRTILNNIKQIIECYQNEFSDMKLLITSRKHFFENQEHKDQLLQRIGNPELLQIAPIDRKKTEEYLLEYAKEINKEEKFNKLKDFYDPIELASKPLFLEMIKASLEELPNDDLDELILYETYIRQSLERKFEYLEDEGLETSPITIIENMKEILENLAVKLHQSDKEFIYLSEVHGSRKALRGLWEMSNPEANTNNDETGRIAVRSLLKRVGTANSEHGKQWPVDFCHRSMREYFVARAVCKMMEHKLEQARQFLRNYYLNHEIVFFAFKMMKKSGFDYTENLWQLIRETKGQSEREKFKVGHLGSNAANLLYQYRGTLPHHDWSCLVLDGVDFSGADLSGKDFSHTSFHYANLDNVNFTNTDFSNCDLTGVRLEEASPVHAIAVTCDENIYALYDDGIIREWKYKRVGNPYPDNLEKIQKLNYIRLIAQPGNDLTFIDDRQLIFFDKENKRLKERARIDIKPSLIPIKASSDTLLLFNEADNQHILQLVDLEKQSLINEKTVEHFALCDHLGTSAFIIYGKNQYLQIVDITSQQRKTILQPCTENITCLDTCSCKDSPVQYRLACGQADGKVVVLQVFLSKWEVKKIFECHYHEKTVNDIAFIDEENIISGGFDKKIFKINISQEENAPCKPVEFKLHLQCKGMKIAGIKPDEKRLFLEKLIAKASTGDDVYKEK